MQDLVGKTAFVTGGANGIGLALAQAFAEAGMNVMLADVEQGALAAAVERLRDFGPKVRGLICDVADPSTATNDAVLMIDPPPPDRMCSIAYLQQ